MAKTPAFSFGDESSFEENLECYVAQLNLLDDVLGPVLSASLPSLAESKADKSTLLSSLLAGLETESGDDAQETDETEPSATTDSKTDAPNAAVVTKEPGWFLERLEIEGFRGVNNEGAPLVLKFKPERINSVSAPNGVGKSSIYDALSFALTGGIPKLDELLAAECGHEYYVNRFHPKTAGTIKLAVRPDGGANEVVITITRDAAGNRTVSATDGIDGPTLLQRLNREFVLLDSHTFQRFIGLKALDRGRTFAGLLGLARYSALRQELQALSNTRAFNTHFDTSGAKARKTAADRIVSTATAAIAKDYEALVKSPIDLNHDTPTNQAKCHAALHGIPTLSPHCDGTTFSNVDIDQCIETIKAAEGGDKRVRLGEVIREHATWTVESEKGPAGDALDQLATLTEQRDLALAQTSGSMLNELYQLSEQVLTSDDWASINLCPTCERDDGTSVLERVRLKLAQYEKVEQTSTKLVTAWNSEGWSDLGKLASLTLKDEPAICFKRLYEDGAKGHLTNAEAIELTAMVKAMREAAKAHLASLDNERVALEKELPPSLVAATTAVETARRLQQNWKALEAADANAKAEAAREGRVTRVKTLLDAASGVFATAESSMAASRLKRVEPLCREIFNKVMFSPVVPALVKKAGSEELSIRLAEFWTLKDVSAQALLSESFRNAFAVSVYLAAASLYGGAARFVVLDDVTSSFDAGHQHHLIEVMRTSFARPHKPDGPQLIILSHDTLLENLFNKHSSSPEWHHQRLEGNARTAVLLQSGAVNKVRDATNDLLNQGRVDDAAWRIRQYLEYRLNEVIDRCRIPVPMDLAFHDERHLSGEYLKAIQVAVGLHQRAGDLILEPAQTQNLSIHSATIIGNYLSHWSTGQTQAFSAPALQGVMAAIDAFQDCFRYEPAPGAQKQFYKSLSQK